MVTLKISLEEGFSNDVIEIMVNGNMEYQKNSITTNPDLGLAESIVMDVLKGYNDINIFVKTRNISKNIILDITDITYLALSLISNKELFHKISDKPFKYM